MDELITRVVTGNASPADVARVRRWRAESPRNEAHYRQIERVWTLAVPTARKAYQPPSSLAGIVGDEAPSLRPAHAPGTGRSKPRRQASAWPRWGWALPLAAGVAALAIGVRMVAWPSGATPPTATFVAAADAPRTVTLDDGSLVRLAPEARLEQWDAEGARHLSLAGKAFFAVTHDPERPFVVEVGESSVRVLGTRFELDGSAAGLRAVVVEGVVELATGHGAVEVPASSVGQSRRDAAPTVTPVDDVYALLDWPGGLLMFQGTPLATVAEEVGRHFGRVIDVRDSDLGALRISAHFDEEDFDEVAQALCDVSGARCAASERGVTMRPGSR